MQNITQSSRTIGFRKSLTGFICLAGLAVTTALATAAPSQPISPPCAPLSGTFVFTLFQFDSATTGHGEAEIWMNGELVGHASAHYFNIQQMGEGVLQMNGAHIQTYFDGSTLVTHDEIRLQPENNNPGWARANSRLYIVGGTGKFAGATGLLHSHGEANLATLEGGIDLRGRFACRNEVWRPQALEPSNPMALPCSRR